MLYPFSLRAVPLVDGRVNWSALASGYVGPLILLSAVGLGEGPEKPNSKAGPREKIFFDLPSTGTKVRAQY